MTVEIGSANGRILLVIDKESALDLAGAFRQDDGFHRDLMEAVALAYPDEVDE